MTLQNAGATRTMKIPVQIKEIRQRLMKVESSDFFVYTLIAIYTIIFSCVTIARHNMYQSYAWDLGIFDQSLWSTLNRKTPMEYSRVRQSLWLAFPTDSLFYPTHILDIPKSSNIAGCSIPFHRVGRYSSLLAGSKGAEQDCWNRFRGPVSPTSRCAWR